MKKFRAHRASTAARGAMQAFLARPLARNALGVSLPIGAMGCFAYAGNIIWSQYLGFSAEDQLRKEIAAASKVMEKRRLAWSRSAVSQHCPAPSSLLPADPRGPDACRGPREWR